MSAPMFLTKTVRKTFRPFRRISTYSVKCNSSHNISAQLLTKQSKIPHRLRRIDRLEFQTCQLCTGSTDARKCWNCGSELDKNQPETFFCICGVVQYIPTNITFFELMQSDESFDIDTERLSRLYKDLQRQYHPDKFSQKSKDEQTIAESQSAYINKAFTTLYKPLSRGLYLLELRGDPLEEANSTVDPEFLMEIMEVNEDLAEAEGNVKAVQELEAINNARISQCVEDISNFFSEGNIVEAKKSLIQLKYFANVEDKIKEMYRKDM